MKTGYPNDLTDKEWEGIKHFFKRPDPRGNKGYHDKRTIVNGIFYVIKGGIPWRMMPNEYPPWETVYDHYYRLCKRGIWEEILDFLNEISREKQDRNTEPSYAIVDSQSVKTQYDSEDRGFDGGKKVKGRKRHISVDILGNTLCIKVHAANIHDTKAGCSIFEMTSEKYPSIKAFSADAGYRGTSVDYVQDILKKFIDISIKIKDEFAVLPKRWIVERTFAWINNFRRASKDFEILTLIAENIVRIAMIRIMLRQCF